MQLPTSINRTHFHYVTEVMADAHYKYNSDLLFCVAAGLTQLRTRYYKGLRNRLRYDIRNAMRELEPHFVRHPKPRGNEVTGRDKWRWYAETEAEAQVTRKTIALAFTLSNLFASPRCTPSRCVQSQTLGTALQQCHLFDLSF